MAEYSFDGIPFGPRSEGLQPQVQPGPSIYTERHIPYSTATVLEMAGTGPRKYAAPIRLPPEDVVAFEERIQAEGVLVVNGVNWGTATLVSLANHVITPRDEWHFYDAEWIIG